MSDLPPTGSSRPPSRREDAETIVRRLRDAGHVAYFAGGCVRDQLLGKTPKDYDVATDAPPQRVRQLFANTQAVGQAFGVILVRLGASQIEVATFRADLAYKDGRRPEGVVFTTAEEDAKRRDFTINGLFFDPIEQKVIDFVDGQRDLKDKWLRTIGDPDQRFEEDHLRLLRAVRFAARFDLTIKGETAVAIAKHHDQLKRISPERIAEELRLMLTPPTRLRAHQELWRFGLISVIFRHLPELVTKATRPNGVFDQLMPGEPVSFGLALAALALSYRAQVHPEIWALLTRAEARRTAQALRTALRISNQESDEVEAVLDLEALLAVEPPRTSTMKRFLAGPHSRPARLLLAALRASEPSMNSRIQWLETRFAELERQDVAPPPLVTGDDLIAHGLKPGKLFKRVLDDIYDAQLEDRVNTTQEALELAMRIAREKDTPSR
jgi:poly(A) polymerase